MLDVFSLIFVVDTQKIFRYDFVAPLTRKTAVWYDWRRSGALRFNFKHILLFLLYVLHNIYTYTI